MQFDIQSQKKYQVNLAEYDFERDLLSRKLLADLCPAETLHLIELFYLSSKTTLQKLKSALSLDDDELKEFMEKISPLGLLSIEGETVLVDKDAKKNIECFLEKFSDEFSHGIEYFQSLLKQVPISILPNWYSLPRSCESIFQSLKERIFQSPNSYLRHIQEIETTLFAVQPLIDALFHAPDHTLSLSQALELAAIHPDDLDECLLFLEFNFVAVVCYTEMSDRWVPSIKLASELSQYLKERSVSPPFTTLSQNQVKPDRGIPLTFAFDLSQVIRFVKLTPVRATEPLAGSFQFDTTAVEKLASMLLCPQKHIEQVLTRGIELKLLEIDHDFLSLCSQAEQWLLYSIEKQALSLYKALWIQGQNGAKQAEKGLTTLIDKGWVLSSEVIEFVSYGKPSLQRGRDGYIYDFADQVAMTQELLNTLFESGIIEWGSFNNQPCLRLTDLGTQICS